MADGHRAQRDAAGDKGQETCAPDGLQVAQRHRVESPGLSAGEDRHDHGAPPGQQRAKFFPNLSSQSATHATAPAGVSVVTKISSSVSDSVSMVSGDEARSLPMTSSDLPVTSSS